MMRSMALGALLGALSLFSASAASAAGLSVSPIRLQFDPGQRSASLTISNETDAPKVIQVSVATWSQSGGESVYGPAKEVLATPAFFKIPAQSRQLVRVGFPGPAADASVEHTYRVYLQEVPENKDNAISVRFLLRIGIPLFVPPAKPLDALDWQVHTFADGKLALSAENRGNRYVRLDSLQLTADGVVIAKRAEMAYILAGSRIEMMLEPVRPQPPSSHLRLHAETSRGAIETELTTVSR